MTPPPAAPVAPPPVAPEVPAPVEEAGPEVVFVDDSSAQFELSRRVQLVQTGWMVNGEVVCGNHTGADLILPENRIVDDQEFTPAEYFRLKVRGRRGHIDVLSSEDLLVDGDFADVGARFDNLDECTLEVIRRDDAGEEDFTVPLVVVKDRTLPDPRARLLVLDYEDPLAAALVTRGLPTKSPRTLTLGDVTVTFLDTGEGEVVLSGYLDTYRGPEGFRSFFVQRGDARFRTAPEDGSDIHLAAGDRLVIASAVYVLRAE